jgi:membrane fusion protein
MLVATDFQRLRGCARVSPLFRKEVLAARQNRWLGDIAVGRPLSQWLLAGLVGCAAVAIVALLYFGEHTRRTRVVGQLVPSLGMATVISPAAGVLGEVRVEEGQQVAIGEILAVIAVQHATLAGGDTVAAVQTAISARQEGVVDSYASQRLQLEVEQEGLSARIKVRKLELRQIERELGTRRERHALAEQALKRTRGLREKQFVTDLQVQQQQAVVLDQLGRVQSLERQTIEMQREVADLEQALRELPLRLMTLAAAEQRESASLDQESAETLARAETVIRAPISGTVGTLLGQAGQAVQQGQAILSLLPAAGELQAHLRVPSRAIAFVEPGDPVLLRYQAFPFQKFGHYGGKVLRISRSALAPGELETLLGNIQSGEAYYRIVVALDNPVVRAFGKDEPLRPGMLLDADILGEKRRLWEWLIEPLYSLSGGSAAEVRTQ